MRVLGTAVLCAVLHAALPAAGSSQLRLRLVEAGLDQSFTSSSQWSSPAGPMFAIEIGGLPRDLGLRVGYRTLSEPGEDVATLCGAFTCEDGPFRQAYTLKELSVGLTLGVGRISSTEVVLSLDASRYSQARRLRHVATGNASTRGQVSDPGLGTGIELRFPALFFGLRPIAHGGYKRVFQRGCEADAACYGGRNVASVGVGFGWAR